ncbi:MAG: HU family DNA-binding protein [Clostridia bacterium]|nr:HU family DNA-binding protein [Clostridia bacterium]
MNKTELITAVAEKAEITKKDAEKAVTAVLDTIIEQVAEGEEIRIVGFGTFERRERKERTGCDPRTNEKITIPASKVPAFKAGKAFKDAVDKK